MFLPTKATVKLSNGNTGHAQVIGMVWFLFSQCLIIYTVKPAYYCPGHPSNTILSGALKFYIGFRKVTSEPLEHCDFVDSQGFYWRSPYQTHNNLDHFQPIIVRNNPHRDKNTVVSTVCGISKQTLFQLIHQIFGHIYITRLKWISRKGLLECWNYQSWGNPKTG